jgi:amidohydrolase
MNPIEYVNEHQELLMKTYSDLHSLAEPSWQEKKTSLYIKNKLEDAGLKVTTFPDHFGLIAEIKGCSSKVVALRADMDALVQEADGVVKPNHSCGHDAHSTMVLFTALAFAASSEPPKHSLRFIFQPAEEKGEGALKMADDGALEDVHNLFGIHLRPHYEVPFMKASPVIIHGAAGTIKGTIKGRQAHAARPQEGINAIEAAAFLVQQLKQISLKTDIPYSIKMTQLNTENGVANIIPETAHFSIDVRAQTNLVMEDLKKLAHQVFDRTMENTGAKVICQMEEFVPAAMPNNTAIQIATEAIKGILGEENLVPVCISQGGEDFHFYTFRKPQLSATMVGLGCGLEPGLHHPNMKFDLRALNYGTKILIQTLLIALNKLN